MTPAEKRAAANNGTDGYNATLESIEHDIYPVDYLPCIISIAISLKRMADHMEKISFAYTEMMDVYKASRE